VLLAVLEDGPQHGYAVIEALRSGNGGALDLPTGTSGSGLGQIENVGVCVHDNRHR
jgi:PadR family transcriptional regulator